MRYDEHLALHGLVLKKLGTPAVVAETTGLDEDVVRSILDKAVAVGRVGEFDGKYALLPAGKMIVAGEYSRHYADARRDHAFVDAYEDFEKVNNDLKAVITRWQTHTVAGSQVPNDHSDAEYDEKVIDRLCTVHERVEPILERLARVVPRMSVYLPALDNALERVE
jgi:pyruvate,orthophosphate dikinase